MCSARRRTLLWHCINLCCAVLCCVVLCVSGLLLQGVCVANTQRCVIKILKPVKKKKIRREIKILQVGFVIRLTVHMGCPIVLKSNVRSCATWSCS
jgi:hypothetical protein